MADQKKANFFQKTRIEMFILTCCNASLKGLDVSNKSRVALGFKGINDLFDQLSRKPWFQRAVCDHKYAVGRDRSSSSGIYD